MVFPKCWWLQVGNNEVYKFVIAHYQDVEQGSFINFRTAKYLVKRGFMGELLD